MSSELTVTSVLVIATHALQEAGFTQATEAVRATNETELGRLFEDEYSVVGVCAWENWDSLRSQWAGAQAWLVEVITARLDRSDAKAWDGYLVLLTPGRVPNEERAKLEAIRYDTTRVRKLVGVDLKSEAAVKRALAPLMPLDLSLSSAPGSELRDLLIELVPPDVAAHAVVEALAEAFSDGRPLVDSIHRALNGEDDAG